MRGRGGGGGDKTIKCYGEEGDLGFQKRVLDYMVVTVRCRPTLAVSDGNASTAMFVSEILWAAKIVRFFLLEYICLPVESYTPTNS